MTSVFRRFSAASATSRICSGRLFMPLWPPSVVKVEAELGGDHHLVAHRRQRLAEQFLVVVGAIGLGGVEEGDAALERGADQGDCRLLLRGRAIAVAEAHAAEAEGGDFEAAFAECALFHGAFPCLE